MHLHYTDWMVRALVCKTDNSFYLFRVWNNTKKWIVQAELEADGPALIPHTGCWHRVSSRLRATSGSLYPTSSIKPIFQMSSWGRLNGRQAKRESRRSLFCSSSVSLSRPNSIASLSLWQFVFNTFLISQSNFFFLWDESFFIFPFLKVPLSSPESLSVSTEVSISTLFPSHYSSLFSSLSF